MPTTTTGIATSFINFTRASNATVTDSDGKVKWAPHNLLTDSESFDSALWLKSGIASVSANNTAAPNGTTTADKFLEDTSVSAQHLCNKSISVGGDQTYSFSCFAKSAERTNIALQLATTGGTVTRFGANFDLSAGTVSKTDSISSPVNTSSSITPVGTTGWYLCTIKMTTISTATALYCYVGPSDSNNPTFSSGSPVYTGVSGNGAFFWGASFYRSDLGGMQPNTSAYPMYNPTTPKNLLGRTEDYSGTGWARSNVTASGSIVAPNGLSTADTITSTSSVATDVGIYAVIGTGVGYTISIYAKAGTSNIAWVSSETSLSYAVFNLATQSVISSANGTPSITPVGDGWYRIALSNLTIAGPYFVAGGKDSYTSGAPWGNGTWTSGNTIYLWGAQLSDSASLDPYVPVYGAAVTSAAYYGPRRDFDGATLACKGLLVEEQRTNLITYSEAFDDAVWAGVLSGITSRTANTTTAPTGTTIADTITANNVLTSHYIGRAVTWTAAIHTISVYVKTGTQQFFQITTYDGTTSRYANFDIQAGTVGTTNNATSSIAPVGGGWYRCVLVTSTAQAAASGNFTFAFANSSSATGNISYATAGTETFYLWGAQLEANASFATSYIPVGSTTAGATRLPDVASVSTQAFPYSASASSIVIALQHLTPTTASGTNHGHWILQLSGSAVVRQDRIDSSALIAFRGLSINADTGKTVGSSVAKIGTTFSTGDVALVVNGGTAYTSAAATGSQSADTLILGRSNVASTEYINGYIRQVTYLPRKLSVSELQTRTA